MATCKDCLHYHACVDMLKLAFPKTKEKEIEQTSTRENNCRNFKPTADVVLRAEVESIFDELIKAAGEIAESYKEQADNMSCSDFARTEYRGTQIGALLVQYQIASLKKKYEGEE